MTPEFGLIADDQDITAAIRARLLSLRLTDAAGYESDLLEIKIDDRDGNIALPRTGTVLRLTLGYGNNLRLMGRFTVDEIRLAGPAMTLMITARAADFKKQLKQQKTRAWEGKRIGAIVRTIAGEHDLEAVVSDNLSNIVIPRLDQTDESDLHLLTRLGRDYDAVAKPANKRLIFAPKGEARAASGQPLPTITLQRRHLSSWSARLAERDKYLSARAYYHDAQSGLRTSVTAGQGKPSFALRVNHPDRASALSAAKSKLEALNRGAGTVSLTMPGNPDILAESPLELTGIRPGVDGRWVVTSVIHELSRSGYVTRVEGESSKP